MSSVNSLVKGSCETGCNTNKYVVAGSDLTNGDCSWSFPLGNLLIDACDVAKFSKTVAKGEYASVAASMIGMTSINQFFLNFGNSGSLNSTISISSDFSVDGSVVFGSVNMDILVDSQEMVITWNNFHLKPINTSCINWDEGQESWIFYSVPESTTNTSMFTTFSSSLSDINFLATDTAIVTFEFGDAYGKKLLFDVSFDQNGNYEIIKIYGYAVRFRTIYDEATSSVFFRDVLLFDKCEKLYLSMLHKDGIYNILNEDQENQKIDFFTASLCPETNLSTCCCNS